MGADAPTGPVQARDRIATLDLLRGVAICGILLMNIPYMGGITERSVPGFPARWNADWIAWGLQKLLADGTMRGLFEMLFGAGMLLVLRTAEGAEGRTAPFDVWTRRCWALMALGVVQWAIFMWPGEILWLYGLSGLFLLAFRAARVRALLTGATILLTAFSIFFAYQGADRGRTLQASIPAAAAKTAGKQLTEEQTAALKVAEEVRKSLHPTAAEKLKIYSERTHLASLFGWSWGLWKSFNLVSESWAWLSEALGFMLIGMALFRTGILTGVAPFSTYVILIGIGYPGGIGLRAFILLHNSHSGFDIDAEHASVAFAAFSGAVYQLSRLLITLGHIGLIVALFRSDLLGDAWPVRALGRMALTVYSLQSVLTSLLFYGFGLVGRFDFAALMGIAVTIWIVTCLFCVVWLARFEMGPAEWLLRSVAYARWRPMRRAATENVAMPVPAL